MGDDEGELEAYVTRAVTDLGATMQAATILIGDELGLYRAMADGGPCTPAELGERTGTAQRYVTEWLRAQAAGGYVSYEPVSQRYSLDALQERTLLDEDDPLFLPRAFRRALAATQDRPAVARAFRTGEGVGRDLRDGNCEHFVRPGQSKD